MNFQYLTGPYFDSICQAAGLRPPRLRTISGAEITPAPLLSYLGPQSTTDIGFQLEDAELLDTWEATIPIASLQSSIGSGWPDAVAADQLWEIHDGTDWKVYRTYGKPKVNTAGARVGLVFKADANTVDSLGLEAPYMP